MTQATELAAYRRPETDEYKPYYGQYIDVVPQDNILEILESQIDELQRVLEGIDESEAAKTHAPYTWTIKQVVGHMIDCERVFGYRALRFASGDAQPIPGFEQNDYVDNTDYDRATLADLTSELKCSRRAHAKFFRRIAPAAWDRQGTADGASISVRAIAYIMAGHLIHHLEIIRQRTAEKI